METSANITNFATVPSGVGDAVGVPNRQWYVAIIGNNTEKKCADKLRKAGYECYLPTQEEVKVWKNGRKSNVERVLIPAKIFVYCTEQERKQIVFLPYIKRFLINILGAKDRYGKHPLAIIPNSQIETLKFMLGQTDIPVCFVQTSFKVSDTVEVIRGSLRGLIGQVLRLPDDKCKLIVSIDLLGGATVDISSSDLRIVV